MSVRCPETERSWRYSYDRLGCRCAVCTAQNTAKSERHRRRGDRIQRRMTTTAILCPFKGKPTATAYREGCRCDTCRPSAARRLFREGARYTNGELEKIMLEAIGGLRADTGLLVHLAQMASDNAVLFAEWDRAAPDDGHYYVATRTGSTTNVVRVPGGPTGPRIGYTPDSNYIGGASFSPSGKVASVHHDPDFGGSVLRVWDGTTSRIVAYSHRRMGRPVWIDDTEILVGDVVHYVDYFDYLIHQRSVRA